MILIFPIIFLLLALWGIIRAAKHTYQGDGEGEAAAIGLGGGLFICTAIVFFLIALANGEETAIWKEFYNNGYKNSLAVVNLTRELMSSATDTFEGKIVNGSIEKLEQAKAVSERLANLKDEVNLYNKTIASMKYYNHNIWTGILVPDEIEELKPISISE